MGGTFSEPIPRDASDGFVAIVLRSFDKIRLLHAPRSVMEMTQRIVRELGQYESADFEDKHGSMQLRLPGSPFALSGGKESLTIGKLFVLKMLEEMYILGYDLITSTDLSRAIDQGTLIFKLSAGPEGRIRHPMLCVAPMGSDRLVLTRCGDLIIDAVRRAIEVTWTPGIQQEIVVDPPSTLTNEQPQFEFKLRGNPWYGEGDASVMCRRLVLEMITNLAAYNWKFHSAINVRGGADVMYFIYDKNYYKHRSDLALLSLNRCDRVRLFNFDYQVAQAIKSTILRFHQTKDPEERNYHGVQEFKLKGYPFASNGDEAMSARQLMCRMFEALRDCGWEIVSAIDITRKINDKSIFVFGRCESAKMKFACVATSEIDSLYLLNFPFQISQTLCQVVSKHYLPGVCNEVTRDAGANHQIILQGPPWSQNSSYNLHARSMLVKLIKEASTLGWQVVSSADISAKYIHQENGHDYPVDAHSIFFCFMGLPRGIAALKSSTSMTYAELKVSDLEDLSKPPRFVKNAF